MRTPCRNALHERSYAGTGWQGIPGYLWRALQQGEHFANAGQPSRRCLAMAHAFFGGVLPDRLHRLRTHEDPPAAAGRSETKNRYFCISKRSEDSFTDTLFETRPLSPQEQDGLLLGRLPPPVVHWLGSLSLDYRKCGIDRLSRYCIRCKYTLVLGYLAKLTVIVFLCWWCILSS